VAVALIVLMILVMTGPVVIERIHITGHPELEQGVSVRQFRATPVVDWHTEQANRGHDQQQPASSSRLIC
jgi:hypothetical protein